MSKIEQKFWTSMTGFSLMFGNILANSYGFPKIGIGFGILALYYLLKALRIRPDKGE